MQMSERQEAPPEFKFWTGAAIIGAVMRRNVWLEYFETIVPNLFVVLVGASGQAKKSTTTDIAPALLEGFDHIYQIVGRTTPEELLGSLVRSDLRPANANASTIRMDGSAFIISSEFTSLLEGQERMLGLLGDLYKSPKRWDYKTKNMGRFKLENVAVSLLAASTPKWLRKCIPDSEVGEGFVGRTLWIASTKVPARIAWPDANYRRKDDIKRLRDDLLAMSDRYGEFHLEKDAVATFTTWYEGLKVLSDERVQAFEERKHVNVLKLAMICTLDLQADLIINNEMIKSCIKMVDAVAMKVPDALMHVGTPTLSADAAHIFKVIRSVGGVIDHANLQRRLSYKLDAESLARALMQLELEDRITVEYRRVNPKRKPQRVYSITEEREENVG